MTQAKKYSSYLDFINDDDFVIWRLYRTRELDIYWNDFIEKNPQSRDIFNEAVEKFGIILLNKRAEMSNENKIEVYQKIQESALKYDKARKQKKLYRWFAAAAIAIIIIISGIFVRQFNTESILAEEIAIGYSMPSKNVEIISNNQSLPIDDNTSFTLIPNRKGDMNLIIDDDAKRKIKLSNNSINKLIVPAGKRSFLTLSDGTRVWVNSDSELEFPSLFSGNSRDISVKGEIYIDVAKSENQPFHVHTNDFTVRVYGTKFDVSAYADEESYVVLVDGKVKTIVNNLSEELKPNEKVTFNHNSRNFEKELVDVKEYISWKDGFMMMNNTTMEEILSKIGRYYNVNFTESDIQNLGKEQYSGKLYLSSQLDSVLTSLSKISSMQYNLKEKTVYMQRKK